ncbi:MAG: ssDNA-binding domain-containing protein [Prevotella sp.]|nr:ssDNA-binding domain-containing protein [Prevotella sp.]
MKKEVSNKQAGAERVVSKFTDQMIQTIRDIKAGWRKSWISTSANGQPMNLSGRSYNRMNEFFLYLFCEAKKFRYPVFVTLHAANAMGAHVNKGAESAPVLFWKIDVKSKDGRHISIDEYRNLSKDRQADYETFPVLKYYNVFNIQDTNLGEVQPEKVDKFLSEHFVEPELRNAGGMYANEALDALVSSQSWVCPISLQQQDRAFYSQTTDSITLPVKEQFNLGGTEDEVFVAGQEFYSTMLHEMTHSTGASSRLDRLTKTPFGSPEYAREELVAELTAALMGHKLGFNTRVQDNSAAYLSSWLKSLGEDPKFLVSVLADVSKAAQMIEQHIGNGEVA